MKTVALLVAAIAISLAATPSLSDAWTFKSLGPGLQAEDINNAGQRRG